MNQSLATTPLYDWHVSQGARVVDFAGWQMPVQYSSIVAEHNATRTAVGLFDISHMGRIFLTGEGVPSFLERLLTRRTSDMRVGRIRYSLICNEQGGILDDVLIYRLRPELHLLVVNAGNREKILAWLKQHQPSDVEIDDQTTTTAMIAIQGPLSAEAANPICDLDVTEQKYYTGTHCQIRGGQIAGVEATDSRTGYTGEDGWEITVPGEIATDVWQQLVATQLSNGESPSPVGLGARDTLRLEAAMPLYGHELNEDINPIEADLGFAVNAVDRDFFGCATIAAAIENGVDRTRVGLEMQGRRIAREHYPIVFEDQVVGEVTSGTLAPTVEKPIGMGYVPTGLAEVGRELHIDIRGRLEAAKVVALPFYSRKK